MENKEHFRQKARGKRAENKKFFRVLKKLPPRALDRHFHRAHEKAFAEINCLDCALCCKTTGPLFTGQDIDRLARHLNMRPGAFIEKYLRRDEEGDFVLQQLPCPFLGADNFCSVYEVRPKACRNFPHTDRPRMHQILNLTRQNAEVCPAVDEMVEGIKADLNKSR